MPKDARQRVRTGFWSARSGMRPREGNPKDKGGEIRHDQVRGSIHQGQALGDSRGGGPVPGGHVLHQPCHEQGDPGEHGPSLRTPHGGPGKTEHHGPTRGERGGGHSGRQGRSRFIPAGGKGGHIQQGGPGGPVAGRRRTPAWRCLRGEGRGFHAGVPQGAGALCPSSPG